MYRKPRICGPLRGKSFYVYAVSPSMFTIKNTTYNMRDNMKLIVPKPKTVKYGKRSLKYEGSRLWNLLTNATKLAVNFKVFKRFIMLWPRL